MSKDPEISASATLLDAPKSNDESSNPSTGTPGSRSQLNATAPQFTPQATKPYRSVLNATSTNSNDITARKLLGNQHSPPPHPESTSTDSTVIVSRVPNSGHIFGDHLLPGGKIRKPIEIKRPKEAKKLEESHIIGNHLLPGRRETQVSMMKPGDHPTAASVLTYAAASKPGFIAFSLPTPPKSANLSIASTAKAQNGSTLTSNAPAFNPMTLCLIPNNTTAPSGPANNIRRPAPAILESIHAPKPRKSSYGQGLQGSRYADPKCL
ncbi:hypothetical protein BJX63DRAFT_234592 [Aspergillus granulosus]|uniref:Uncharacterized protein n=1 Tax=Aspergillus granulosus TaxID=176169 RepID=A0ABR4HBG5_9EURO